MQQHRPPVSHTHEDIDQFFSRLAVPLLTMKLRAASIAFDWDLDDQQRAEQQRAEERATQQRTEQQRVESVHELLVEQRADQQRAEQLQDAELEAGGLLQ